MLRPGGTLTVCIDFFEENPHCHGWQPMMGVPMTLLSEAKWRETLELTGFVVEESFRCYDPRPVDESKSDEERAAEEHFRKEVGSLALRAVRS